MDRAAVSLLAGAAGVLLHGCGSAPAPAPTPTAQTITGYIYCDNRFDFYFNGELIATDPLDFRPHQALSVSFEWDGVSDKTYAILCQDFATDSGYEYNETDSPGIGDGALLAEFDDGTRTSSAWKVYTTNYGPTAASEAAGCAADNLAVCELEDFETPADWYTSGFDDSSWAAASEFTVDEAGWGRTPIYTDGQCGELASPYTREILDPAYVTLPENECLNPKTYLCGGLEQCNETDQGRFIWNTNLQYDNIVLFRLTVSAAVTK